MILHNFKTPTGYKVVRVTFVGPTMTIAPTSPKFSDDNVGLVLPYELDRKDAVRLAEATLERWGSEHWTRRSSTKTTQKTTA